jgi:hypothetical protein
MTKSEALKIFKTDIIPNLRFNDAVAIRTAWNDYVDSLEKSGDISLVQSCNWTNPF